VDVVSVLGVVRLIIREEENLILAQNVDLVLVSEEVLALLLVIVSPQLLRTLDHGVDDHKLLVLLVKREDLVGTTTDGNLGGQSLLRVGHGGLRCLIWQDCHILENKVFR